MQMVTHRWEAIFFDSPTSSYQLNAIMRLSPASGRREHCDCLIMAVKGFGAGGWGGVHVDWHTGLVTILPRLMNRKEILHPVEVSVQDCRQERNLHCNSAGYTLFITAGLNPVPKKFISTQVSDLQIFSVIECSHCWPILQHMSTSVALCLHCWLNSGYARHQPGNWKKTGGAVGGADQTCLFSSVRCWGKGVSQCG